MEEVKYDSTADTLKHVKRVSELLGNCAIEFIKRGQVHDNSKLVSPEKELFDEYTPKLKHVTYGSPEYDKFREDLSVALQHHYANNTHHPEHYEKGVDDMTLFDIMEMLMDWKASSERHNDGNICKSISINAKRFNMSPQMEQIFKNTVKTLGW